MGFLSEVGAIFGFGPKPQTIEREALKDELDAGTVALVDVREVGEFEAGHVPGAINVPLTRFSIDHLPNDGRTVVLMCRSGARARMAFVRAAAAGRPGLKVYNGSMLDWSAAGEDIVRGNG